MNKSTSTLRTLWSSFRSQSMKIKSAIVLVTLIAVSITTMATIKNIDHKDSKSNFENDSTSGNNSNSQRAESATSDLNAAAYQSSQKSNSDSNDNLPQYDFTEAPKHIGENVAIVGNILKSFKSNSGVVFLDYCPPSKSASCPFTAVIFKSDADKFADLGSLRGRYKVTGTIRSYKDKAEIILNSPDQITKL